LPFCDLLVLVARDLGLVVAHVLVLAVGRRRSLGPLLGPLEVGVAGARLLLGPVVLLGQVLGVGRRLDLLAHVQVHHLLVVGVLGLGRGRLSSGSVWDRLLLGLGLDVLGLALGQLGRFGLVAARAR
jgi:hypothetical protein